MSTTPQAPLVLATGTTGYVGGRRGWLEFRSTPRAAGATLGQTAFFAPKGLPGLHCWCTLYPVHSLIFSGLVRALARAAVGHERRRVPPQPFPVSQPA